MIGRRRFLGGAVTLSGVGFLALGPRSAAGEPPPETTRLRLTKVNAICVAPEYAAEELLRAEGFTDVEYVQTAGTVGKEKGLAAGDVDLTLHFAASLVVRLDAGDPIVILAGVHSGCFELFGTERVRAIRDLKGKTVAVLGLGEPEHVFVSSMLAHVGLDPRKDVRWVASPPVDSIHRLAEGSVDAYLAFPPFAQELRDRKIGHVVTNSTVDRPWSQYFCCMVVGRSEFVRKHPVATKRAIRAILKASELCAQEPERVARSLVDKGYTVQAQYEYARQTLREVPYLRWREFDPEDTIRFYALRLHEAGMIKSSPQKIIAQGTDWRFLNELKKELKT